MDLSNNTILHRRELTEFSDENSIILVDRDGPNWIATDKLGSDIISAFDGKRSIDDIVSDYALKNKLEWPKAWQHVETLARDALRHGIVQEQQFTNGYTGRLPYIENSPLSELWVHTNNSCNLSCNHCLVSSGPDGDPGLSTELVKDIISQARKLGTKRIYFTGGEPLVRKDFFELCAHVLEDPEAQLAVLTNGILLEGKRLEKLSSFDKDRIRLQISLDGSSPEINDPIRGNGSFPKIIKGIQNSIDAGFHVTVTTAITHTNISDVPEVTRLISSLGGKRHHLLWLHKRGRAEGNDLDIDSSTEAPFTDDVINIVRKAQETAIECGVTIDNYESLKIRLNVPHGAKRDLSNACVSSLCVYSDGLVYPSAATANVEDLTCGSIHEQSLNEIWQTSKVAKTFREATVEKKEICKECPLKYLCGGGDIEHSYFYEGSVLAHDPYCKLHMAMIDDCLVSLAEERKAIHTNGKSGFNAPIVFTGMGDRAVTCADDEEVPEVITSHSECVLSFELDATRVLVRDFYGNAAETPQAELCCPTKPNPEDITHIPKEVIERFYGCGSPVDLAGIKPGETTLDLGSGAGIDVFIAAKKVGPTGKAIGVDMTDQMLAVARESKIAVAKNLGYDAVDFRHGFLEEIPAEDASVDLVTSNCVINLSPDKKLVMAEMWRILKNHGRVVVSDIVSDEEVPTHQRRDPRLWGECISGALTEEEFVSYLERTGFYGIQVIKKTFWKEVEGHRFYSVTVRGYKFEKSSGCVFVGQKAIYQGPFKGITDEEGHFFPRGIAVEVCTDTAAKLSHSPYCEMFIVGDPSKGETETFSCSDDDCCC